MESWVSRKSGAMTDGSYSLAENDLDHVLAHTGDCWDDLRGGRLFLTGGTGFFGMWLVESFLWINRRLDLGAQVTVLSRDPAAFLRRASHLAGHPALSFQTGDVRTFPFPEGPFSHVIHAATESSPQRIAADRLAMLDLLVGGTRRSLDFARHTGARRFLLPSSGAVYGDQPPELRRIPEEYVGAPDPLAPPTVYSQGKRMAEHLCALYSQQKGLGCCIARCFSFVGPYMPLSEQLAIGNFIRDALRGGPIRVAGDGAACRSYLYAADLAIWLWTILLRGECCRAYNVGGDTPVTIADLARLIAGLGEPPCEVEISRGPTISASGARYVPSTRRAESELGLRSWIDLAEAVRRTLDWHRWQRKTESRPSTFIHDQDRVLP